MSSIYESKEYKAYEIELETLIKQEKELHNKILDIVNKMQKLINVHENSNNDYSTPQFIEQPKIIKKKKEETETETNDYEDYTDSDEEDPENNIISEDIGDIEKELMEDEEDTETESEKKKVEKPKTTKKQQLKTKEIKTVKTKSTPKKSVKTKKTDK